MLFAELLQVGTNILAQLAAIFQSIKKPVATGFSCLGDSLQFWSLLSHKVFVDLGFLGCIFCGIDILYLRTLGTCYLHLLTQQFCLILFLTHSTIYINISVMLCTVQ